VCCKPTPERNTRGVWPIGLWVGLQQKTSKAKWAARPLLSQTNRQTTMTPDQAAAIASLPYLAAAAAGTDTSTSSSLRRPHPRCSFPLRRPPPIYLTCAAFPYTPPLCAATAWPATAGDGTFCLSSSSSFSVHLYKTNCYANFACSGFSPNMHIT
jgi:hypothetical protein